jgi:hypothetical protein
MYPIRQLQSANFPNRFIRHLNFLGELTMLRTATTDTQDSLFTIVDLPGGQNQVRLKSVNYPKRYLRHQNFRIVLQEPAGSNDQSFREDSTFFEIPGLIGSGVSFRSINYPDRYIRHRDFHLYLEPVDSLQSRADATFYKTVTID